MGTNPSTGDPHLVHTLSYPSSFTPVSPRTTSPPPQTGVCHLASIASPAGEAPSSSIQQPALRDSPSQGFRRWFGHAGILTDFTWGKGKGQGVQPGWRKSGSETSALVLDAPERGHRSRMLCGDDVRCARQSRRRGGRGRETIPADAIVLPLLIITFSCA